MSHTHSTRSQYICWNWNGLHICTSFAERWHSCARLPFSCKPSSCSFFCLVSPLSRLTCCPSPTSPPPPSVSKPEQRSWLLGRLQTRNRYPPYLNFNAQYWFLISGQTWEPIARKRFYWIWRCLHTTAREKKGWIWFELWLFSFRRPRFEPEPNMTVLGLLEVLVCRFHQFETVVLLFQIKCLQKA